MALIKCRDCGLQISSDAKACVRCGAPSERVQAPNKAAAWVALAVFLLVGYGIFTVVGNFQEATFERKQADAQKALIDAQAEREEKMNAPAKLATCKKDLQCWGDKGSPAAGAYCRDQIEKLATHSMRWTDKFLEPKFSDFRWLDKDRATVTFSGDKAEFQNGFGAYTTVTYECDFDQESNQVLGVRAREGRL